MLSASEIVVQDHASRMLGKRKRSIISCFECHRRKQKCDRLQPCSNCVSRGKQSLCGYEDTGKLDSHQYKSQPPKVPHGQSSICTTIPLCESSLSKIDPDSLGKDLGYSPHHNSNTLSILRRVGTFDSDHLSRRNTHRAADENDDMLSKGYIGCIRSLPSQNIIDVLVDTFFVKVNFEYEIIDETTFRSQLNEWRNVPYTLLLKGPRNLTTDMCYFPALLFQVLAHSVLCQPRFGSQDLECLKYAPGMTFQNVADELSEAGNTVTALLKKTGLSVVTVQADFLRTWYLKCTGSISEAWHMLATSARNAEELGIDHEREPPEPLPLDQNALQDYEWDCEMRRRLWFMLHLWDAHLAVVLGRPMLTDPKTDALHLPHDYKSRRQSPYPTLRLPDDPPTPFTVLLLGHYAAFQYLPTIYGLGFSTRRRDDYAYLEEIDQTLLSNLRDLPAWCRVDGQEFKFDDQPSCLWLPALRETLLTEVQFCRLALHRPYIFSRSKSGAAALTAANSILRSQARLSPEPSPDQYRPFHQVFTAFDAMVLAISIHILYPEEHRTALDLSVQGIRWGIHKLRIMGRCNRMARIAYGVVTGLHDLLVQRMSILEPGILLTNTNKSAQLSQKTADPKCAANINDKDQLALVFDLQTKQGGAGLGSYLSSQLNGIEPPQPTHDLFFQDLSNSSVSHIGGLNLNVDNNASSMLNETHFEGSFTDDSFWVFINRM